MSDELEILRKREAAMREALEEIRGDGSVNVSGSGPAWTRLVRAIRVANQALQPDAGARYLSPEQVLSLRMERDEMEGLLRSLIVAIHGEDSENRPLTIGLPASYAEAVKVLETRLSLEQVKPLVEALEAWCPPETCSCKTGPKSGICSCGNCYQHYTRNEALTHAKSLGL